MQNIKRRASRRNFNPRSPRGERPITLSDGSGESRFQSTLPARGATDDCTGYRADEEFQSTLPARGATAERYYILAQPLYFNPRSPRGERQQILHFLHHREIISIHAPREGSDALSGIVPAKASDFNPRSPRGERRHFRAFDCFGRDISIHAPREGSDAT